MGTPTYISIAKSLLLNGVVIISGILVASRVFGSRGRAGRVTGAFIVSAALIVVSLELLSAFGGIGCGYLLVFHLAALAGIFILERKRFAPDVAVGALILSEGRGNEKVKGSPAFQYAIIGIFAVFFVIAASFALVMPPAPTDAFLDHLVFPAEWLRAGRITLVQTLSPEQATTYYPANGELIYLWLMLPLHDDLIVGIMKALCLLMSVLAAYRIGRKSGLSKRNSGAASAAAALTPAALNQIQQFGIDLFFTASFLCAVSFLLPGVGGKRPRSDVLLAGLAAGLALGSKYLGVVLFLLLMPLVFAGSREKGRVADTLIFLAAAAGTGVFWYVRNLLETGSPFYPLGLNVFGIPVFKGAFTRGAMLHSHLHIPTGDIKAFWKIVSENVFGTWLFAGGVSLFVTGMLKKENKTGLCFVSAYIFLLGPAFILLFWFVNPYNIANNARFVIPGLFFLALLAGLIAERSGWSWIWILLVPGLLIGNWAGAGRFFTFLRDVHAGIGAAAGAMPTVLAAVALTTLGFFVLAERGRKDFVAILLMVCAAAVLVTAKSDYMSAKRYEWYAGHYLGAGWRAMGSIGGPATVAYTGNCSPYGLYGDGLKNKVVYINTDGSRSKLFHDYEREYRMSRDYKPPRDSTDLNHIVRSRADYGEWLAGMSAAKTDFLFATREYDAKRGVVTPVEIEWALEHPESFRIIYNNGDTYIFKFLRD